MSTQPLNFAQMPSGRLLMADGLNPMQRWDGFLAAAQNAGIAAPTTAMTLTGQAGGNYYAYSRFLDGDGNPSNLSPLSNLLQQGATGATGTISGVAADSSGLIKITSTAHGLQSYDRLTITGVTGAVAANSTWTITIVDANTFLLQTSSSSGLPAWTGGGTWLQIGAGAVGALVAAPTIPLAANFPNNANSIGGMFYAKYTFTNAMGETTLSPESGLLNPSPGSAVQFLLPTLPAGATAINLYLTPISGFAGAGVAGSEVFYTAGLTGSTYTFVPRPAGDTSQGADVNYANGNALPPTTTNTCIMFRRTAHGLTTGALANIVATVPVTSAVGNVYSLVKLDANTFLISGGAGLFSSPPVQGLSYAAYGNLITYTNVPVPTDAKVVRRQILRNTTGQTQTFYIDVDTTDIVSTTLTSTKTDAALGIPTAAVPLLRPDGSLNANRYDVPPAHKNCLAHHLGRMFAAGEVIYNAGNVQVTNGSTTVTGIGTAFTSSMKGRFLYIRGATQPYQISSVNTTTQVLTLTVNYADTTDSFAVYAIRPAPAERRLVYYSESGFPEAWPPTNAFSLQEDGDDITALIQKGAYLYIAEKRHLYRFTFQTDPAVDAFTFLVLQRGCVNQRCWVNVEGTTYLLDEQGIHAFAGGNDTQPLSHIVQDLFRFSDSPYRVNWSAATYFHCVHFPQQEVIRWFVVMQGTYLPYHAIALNYREKRWWIEQYSRPIGCSATGLMGNQPQLMVGSDAKKALALWQGTLDGPDPKSGTVRGTATSTTLLSITDTTANFPTAGVVGHSVVLIAGKGKGQVRRIASVSGNTITVKDPWSILPDTSTQYQIGGVFWQYRSGVFRYIEDEENTTRRLELIFNPCTAGPCTADMRLFENLAAAATKWAVTFDSGSGQGVASTAGSGDLTVDLTKANGFVQRRLDRHRDPYSDGLRFASVEVAGVSNADPVSVFQIGLDGAYA